MRAKILFSFIAVLFIFSVISAGCTGMQPSNNDSVNTSHFEPSEFINDELNSVTEEATPSVHATVIPATPIPKSNTDNLWETPKYHVPPAENEDDGYVTIYNETKLLSGVTAFDYNLKTPPMVFNYDAVVPIITRTKKGTSEFGEKKEYTIEVSYPDPLAYYTIVVYDKDTSEVLAEYTIDSFGNEREDGSFKYFSPGNLHIEISGCIATVTTVIEVPASNLN